MSRSTEARRERGTVINTQVKHPTQQKLEGAWNQFKGKLQETWGNLTDDDLDRYKGKKDQLVGFIQEKTGKRREEIRSRIDEIAKAAKYSV